MLPLDDGHHICAQASVPPGGGGDHISPLDEALAELEDLTGWNLRTDASVSTVVSEGRIPRVRALIVTGSEKERHYVVARLESRGYVEIVAALDMSAVGHDSLAAQVDPAGESRPLHVLIVSAGSRRDADLIGATISGRGIDLDQLGPRLVFAGPDDALETVLAHLPQGMVVSRLATSEWGRKEIDDAAIDDALLRPTGAESETDGTVPGSARQQTPAIVSAAVRAASVLATSLQGSVGIVDIGGGSSTISVTPPDGERKRDLGAVLRFTARGTSTSMREIPQAPTAEMRRWLPFDISDQGLRDYLASRATFKTDIAQDIRQLMVEQALARVRGQSIWRGEMKPDFLIATGGVATYPRLSQSVLTLLDIAQPTTPCRVLVDSLSLLARFAPLAGASVDAALAVLKGDTLVNAGVCLSLLGRGKPGDTVAEIGIQRVVDGATEESAEEVHSIRFGTITIIPLHAAEQAAIRVTTARRHSFGIDPAHRPWASKSAESMGSEQDGIAGGVLGLIVDARGRPIELADDPMTRQARLIEWLTSVDAYDATIFSALD